MLHELYEVLPEEVRNITPTPQDVITEILWDVFHPLLHVGLGERVLQSASDY